MKFKVVLFFSFICTILVAHGQQTLPDPITEIPVEYLDLVSFDTQDQVYASNTSGDIYLFNREGSQINFFSPARQGRLSQLEAKWTASIFSFSTDLQEYRFFDRFLNPLSDKGFLMNEINLARVATLGNNNVVWVFDESDLNLKMLDYRRNIIIQSQPLNLILGSDDILQVSEIREFKNRLFVNIPEEGIFMFDNQGNLIQKIKLNLDQRMCFYKEYLFWVEGEFLMTYSLATRAVLKIARLPNDQIDYLQIGQERMALIQDDKIILYPLPFYIKNFK